MCFSGVLFCCLPKYYDVFKVDKGQLPFHAEEDNVHGALKGTKCIAMLRRHFDGSV